MYTPLLDRSLGSLPVKLIMEHPNQKLLNTIDETINLLLKLRKDVASETMQKPIDDICDDMIVSFRANIEFTFYKFIKNPFKSIDDSKYNIKTPTGDVEDDDLASEINNKLSISEMNELQKNPNYNPTNYFNKDDNKETIIKKLNSALNSLYGINGEKLTRTQRVKRNKAIRAFMEKL